MYIKQMKDTRVMIAIIENNSISARIKLIYSISAIGSILAILVTYIISKKLTNIQAYKQSIIFGKSGKYK